MDTLVFHSGGRSILGGIMTEEKEVIKRKSGRAKYVFLRGCNYKPLGDKRYEVGNKDDLTDWTEKHIKNALASGIIQRR